MIDQLHFVEEDGTNNTHEITVYALSTCGFCKRGLQFLRDHSIKFKYIFIDHLDMDTKEKLKSILSDTYRTRIAFPFLVLNGKEVIHGFDIEERENKLLE